MEAILHIGTEKTGTTYLQNFFHLNRKTLFDNGLFYTISAGKENNRALSVASYSVKRKDEETQRLGLNTPDDFHSFRKGIAEKLYKEILSASPEKVLFSSEHFHSRLTQISELETLRHILEQLNFNKFKIVIYLRSPVELATSCYSSYVRNGGTEPCPPSPQNPYFNNICNHKRSIVRWSSVFGKENIFPRIYEREIFPEQSIVNDFLESLGFSSFDYIKPDKSNSSTSLFGLEILRRLNQELDLLKSPSSRNIRAQFLRHVQLSFSHGRYYMPDHLQKSYESFFKESNEWVRSNYFPDRKTLFNEKKEQKYLLNSDIKNCDILLDEVSDFIIRILQEKSLS